MLGYFRIWFVCWLAYPFDLCVLLWMGWLIAGCCGFVAGCLLAAFGFVCSCGCLVGLALWFVCYLLLFTLLGLGLLIVLPYFLCCSSVLCFDLVI